MKDKSNGDSPKIGQILVEQGTLLENQVGEILQLQERDARAAVKSKFGELCVRKGWTDAGSVTAALRRQSQKEMDESGLGSMLVHLEFLPEDQLKQALESRIDIFESIEEIVLDRKLCTPDQVKIASQLLSLHRNGAVRRQVASTFVPFNIMELLISEKLDDALKAYGACTCSLCWSNAFSVALNDLPPRYVSDQGRILDAVQRFRQEYDVIIRRKLADSVHKVRNNPKAACRSRISEEMLSKRGIRSKTHDVVVHISNRHTHVDQATLDTLYGPGYELTKLKDLMQPVQYAAKETISLTGPKGSIDKVRILGPVRDETQVEISGTDQFILGIKAPVRESGKLDGTPGIHVAGPEGEMDLEKGLIRALRHVHMLPQEAADIGLRNGDTVSVRLVGDRTTICEGVLVRAKENSALEMHIDTDEANAAGMPAESDGQIMLPMINA